MSITQSPSLAETSIRRMSRVRYGVLGFILLLTAVAYLDRVCISTASPSIKEELHLTDAQMGYVFAVFTFAYALFEIPSGWLVDRFGPRLMLARIVIWWSIMTALTGWAQGFYSILVIRLLFGIGEAGAFPGIARVFSRWLPAKNRGRGFGLAVMAGALGGAITQPLVVWLLGLVDWRTSFFLFGMVGLLWAVAWYVWFRDEPHHHPGVNQDELDYIGCPSPAVHPPVPWKSMLRSRNLLALCGMYTGVIYGWYFYLTWLPQYLLRARHYDLQKVGWLSSLPLICIAFGVFAGGILSDIESRKHGLRIGRRMPGLIGLPAAAVCILLAISTPTPLYAAMMLALAAGTAALGVAPAWAVCLEIGRRHAGVVSGAMNTFGNLGATLCPVVVGQCLQRWGSWNASLVTLSFFYLFSAACWWMIDPTKPIEGTDSYFTKPIL